MRDEVERVVRQMEAAKAAPVTRTSSPTVHVPVSGGTWQGESGSAHTSRSGKALVIVTMIGGVLLAIGALAAMAGIVLRLSRDDMENVVAAAHREPEELRDESHNVYTNYDTANETSAQPGDASSKERASIDAFFTKLEECAASSNHEEFKTLVDYNRLLKRVELMGSLIGWTPIDKRTCRGEIRATSEVESDWAKITIVGIVTPTEEPNTRVVYTYSSDAQGGDSTACRYWIARDGDTWKLYDWMRLDLGLSESQKWGIFARHAGTEAMAGFDEWGVAIAEADAKLNEGDMAAAKLALQRAEQETVPPELDGYRCVLTGYRWFALDELSEAARCYASVTLPSDTPGAYYGLLLCERDKRPGDALKQANLYEEAVGPTPALLEIKARLFSTLKRDDDAADEWRRLLRIQPEHSYAASEYLLSLKTDDPDRFKRNLDQLIDPVSAISSSASTVGYREYPRLLMLAEYVNAKSPGTPEAMYVSGFARNFDGQCAEAAALFRSAFESEIDETKREIYINEYVHAMASDGKAVKALEAIPNPKSSFEQLYYYYDEEGLWLTKDEYRQVVALHRRILPNDVGGMYREASNELVEKRYEEAERMLRSALESLDASASEESEEDYEGSLNSSLTNALYRQNRWEEAYEKIGDRRSTFNFLARLASYDGRWDIVQALLKKHRAMDADDPQIHSIEGELAIYEKRWDDAVRHLRQGLRHTEGGETWHLKYLLTDACIESGRWLDHFRTTEDQGDMFERLAVELFAQKDWDGVTRLIEEYRKIAPDDSRIATVEAEVAWRRQDYETYAPLAHQLLLNDRVELEDYERSRVESQMISALLRLGRYGPAYQYAHAKQREENNIAQLAIVGAASGNLLDAKNLALEAARERESATEFYVNEEAARIFLGNEFRDLHNEFPVEVPLAAVETVAVLIYEKPQKLAADDLYTGLKKHGVVVGVTAEPVKSTEARVNRAYATRLGNSTVWAAAGTGQFDKNWRVAKKDHALASVIDNGEGWIAIGTATLTGQEREKVEEIARSVAVQLAAKGAKAVYLRGPRSWMQEVYPSNGELLAEWETTGRVKGFKDDSARLTREPSDELAADREYMRALRKAVATFEVGNGARLEVVANTTTEPKLDPLRLQVSEVRRMYGELSFRGVLTSDSKLVQELRVGLPMEFASDSIAEFQVNDELPVKRQ